MPASINMKELLEAGVHFGHQTRRWNPKMKPYIFGSRNGIHIIDLQRTVKLFAKAYDFIVRTVADGYSVLFIGTKKQAHDSIIEESERCGMFFVVNRWLGGTLTHFQTTRKSIARLKELESMKRDGTITRYTKKEVLKINEEIEKLNRQMGGIKEMTSLPSALFIVDPTREDIALAEAKRMAIPVVGIVDTNCNPDLIDYPVPANDDAIRAIKLICSKIADAVLEGKAGFAEIPAEAEELEGVEGAEAVERMEPFIFTPEEE